mmetsp:Transcript_16516/g.34705  ORF Transcript_16516/g.34705 Transcript_16516/m.34705 type:complete len:953 (-) Transcript_16516:256-3114(-)|eukprot:CAMPEP_0171344762 /NCGR_PEP_ID=MMETSP0878-20121228/20075_1 /TAXON_ID=67004 /ORGANISM="Thalassiosira weissflogii, Strain CCMP1336" /LENGTH=952 /DNA_ID=CAMNT_0011848023 /DNA_START=70 /DNA_END=2928 /DNA_ORIENTATION=-
MRRQHALHLLFGGTIALGLCCGESVAERGAPSSNNRQAPQTPQRGGRSSSSLSSTSFSSFSNSNKNSPSRRSPLNDLASDDFLDLYDDGEGNDFGDASFLFEDDGFALDDDSDVGQDETSGSFREAGDYLRDDESDDEYGQGSEKGALYDAYNLLHSLAQDFQKPFDAPAVVVVGHQSSGKSALIEALMGFQFNQVGGGTKTRRPVSLRMQYNPRCAHPRCFLTGDDGIERPKSLTEIQEYIEAENRRLEKDPVRSFDPREINVRMEYKYCPNMILIDTPGLISAPRIRKDGSANVQQRALLHAAREAERLVVSKMRCPDYIILCVEDTMDWKHGTTREVVQKADPDLSRTVIVNTKLDTKLPQFGAPNDVADFIVADIMERLSPHKLGGPFYTSVPSGRVRRVNDVGDDDDFMFDDDDEFVSACAEKEDADREYVWNRVKRLTLKEGKNPKSMLPKVGISRLRGFLERRVDECYRRNVAKIVPLLKAEYIAAERRLKACERELEAISLERLKAGADAFCDDFCKALKDSIQGSIIAPASHYGETLDQENLAAGSFADVQGCPMSVSDRTWDLLLISEVGNTQHKLYGGSQYHRVLREFNLATRCLRLPTITEDEIANAAGIGETHDGVNFLRAACVIALEKAQMSFDPLLDALRLRISHIMSRLCPVSEYMIRQKHERKSASYQYIRDGIPNEGNTFATDIAHNPQFRQLVRTLFDEFVQKCSDNTMVRCRDDLTSMTRFVTWDLQERGGGALRRALPDQQDIVSVYQVAVEAAKKGQPKHHLEENKSRKSGVVSTRDDSTSALSPMEENEDNRERDYANLVQLMEEALCTRDSNRTNLVVGGLVQHIVQQWREAFCKSAITKFNCYFMLPFVDDFHRYLRTELHKVSEGEGTELSDIFDLTAARRTLQQQLEELRNECAANKKLQEKFSMVAKMMQREQERSIQTNFPGQ